MNLKSNVIWVPATGLKTSVRILQEKEEELKKRESAVEKREKELERFENRIMAKEAYTRMGIDFERMLKGIKSDPDVEREWNKFLVFWRLKNGDGYES